MRKTYKDVLIYLFYMFSSCIILASPLKFTNTNYDAKIIKEKDITKEIKISITSKPKIKYRFIIIDNKICSWGNSLENAYNSGLEELTSKYSRIEYHIKDITVYSDNNRYVCVIRFTFQNKIPENYKIETDMVNGFGKTKSKAYMSAYQKVLSKVKDKNKETDTPDIIEGINSKVYFQDFIFTTINGQEHCKIKFAYFKK